MYAAQSKTYNKQQADNVMTSDGVHTWINHENSTLVTMMTIKTSAALDLLSTVKQTNKQTNNQPIRKHSDAHWQ